MSNHSHHEDNWHRGNTGNAGLEMREVNYPPSHPQSRYPASGRDRGDEYGNRVGHWMDERKYGPQPPSSRQPQSHPPPPSRSIDDRGRNFAQNPPPHFSHPPSPSQRPRTPPPPNSRNAGGDAGSRASPWDPVAAGPMSAPPSMVPRMHPNQSSSHGMHHPNASSHHTSPLLPALPNESGRSSSEGLGNHPGNPSQMNSQSNSGHHRIPSWGAQSAKEGLGMRSPPRNVGSAPGSNASRMGGPGSGPYRGESMGPYGRNAEMNNPPPRSIDSRKRPASESPPTSMGHAPLPPQQASPTQRADVMSMSSILGPSGGRASSVAHDFAPESDPVMNSAEKRRRLEAGQGSPSKGDNRPSSQGRISNGSANGSNSVNPNNANAISISEAAAANLARRKWSGPIAEEAAQQAAAWRAQEQRWGAAGSTRSPKVGMMALGGAGERQNSPFGQRSNLSGRGASPIGQEGHRRQRSDGLQAPPGPGGQPSPLARTMPLRPPSPPPSSASQQGGRAQSKPPKQQPQPQMQQQPPPLPPHSQQHQAGPGGFGGAPPPGYYRGTTPPPPGANLGPPPGNGMQQQHFGPGPPPQHQQQMYNQPSYHAYDNQGRPMEIDVDEVRGGAFAGHGNPPPPPHMTEAGYRHAMGPYEEPPMMMQPRPPQMQNPQSRREPGPPSQGHAKKSSMHLENKGNISQRSVNQQQGPPPGSQPPKQVRRSVSPIMPGPARGLLPPRLEKQRPTSNARPLVPSKDFNAGPKVDSDAVRVALKEAIEAPRGLISGANTAQSVQEEHLINADSEYSIPFGKHLGSFIYDARKTPLLSGDLLRRNVGATLEVRIPGKALGVGPQSGKDRDGILHGRWAVNSELNNVPDKAQSNQNGQANGSANGDATSVSDADADIDAFAFWNNDVFLKRKAWGTDVYTDDSDVVMMCLHSGYLLGPNLESVPAWVPPGKAVNAWKRMTDDLAMRAKNGELEENDNAILSATVLGPDADQAINLSPESIKGRNERLDKTMDISVVLRVAPQLIAYKGSQRGGVKTRSWGNTHDGVSLVIESVQLQPSGYASGERGLKRMKQRIDQLARLKMLATIAGDAGAMKESADQQVSSESPINAQNDNGSAKDQLLAGGLLDILAAAKLISNENEIAKIGSAESALETQKRFWQFDPMIDVKAA